MDYTTVEALREFGPFDEEDNKTLNALIATATRLIDGYTGRIFAVEDESKRTFRKDRRFENPFEGPILYFDQDLAEAASLITDSPTVTYVPENIPPYFAMILTEGTWALTVEVTGYWGYSRTPPEDIQFACLRLSKWLYELRDTTRADAVITTAEGLMLVPQGLPVDVTAMLQPYRRVRFAR